MGIWSLDQVRDPKGADEPLPAFLNQSKALMAGRSKAPQDWLLNRSEQRQIDGDTFVESCFAKLKQHRAVVTRYDKRSFAVIGGIHLVAIVIWLIDRRLQFHLK